MMHLSGPGPKRNRTPTPLLNAGKFSRVAHLFCRGGVKVLWVCSRLPGWAFPPSRASRTPSLLLWQICFPCSWRRSPPLTQSVSFSSQGQEASEAKNPPLRQDFLDSVTVLSFVRSSLSVLILLSLSLSLKWACSYDLPNKNWTKASIYKVCVRGVRECQLPLLQQLILDTACLFQTQLLLCKVWKCLLLAFMAGKVKRDSGFHQGKTALVVVARGTGANT